MDEKWEKVSPRNGSGSFDEFLQEKEMRKNPRVTAEKGELPVVRMHRHVRIKRMMFLLRSTN
jgi:hypothetical protein